MTNFNQEEFLHELDCKLSHVVINTNLTLNETFDQFVTTFAETINQFSPMRKVSHKEKKLRLNPWLTGSLDCKLSHVVINTNLKLNETFDQFVTIFAETINQFSPMRKVSHKEKKTSPKSMAHR